MPVKPLAPRYTIEDLGDKLVVSMRSLKIWSAIFVFGIWSFCWAGIEIFLIFALVNGKATVKGDRFSFAIFTLLWTGLGAFFIYNLLQQLLGKEEIQVTDQAITISQVVLGYRRSKEYLAEYIKDLGLMHVGMQDLVSREAPFPWRSHLGSISFDYGARTYRFAASLDDAEAKQLIAAMQQKYPQYKKQVQEP